MVDGTLLSIDLADMAKYLLCTRLSQVLGTQLWMRQKSLPSQTELTCKFLRDDTGGERYKK